MFVKRDLNNVDEDRRPLGLFGRAPDAVVSARVWCSCLFKGEQGAHNMCGPQLASGLMRSCAFGTCARRSRPSAMTIFLKAALSLLLTWNFVTGTRSGGVCSANICMDICLGRAGLASCGCKIKARAQIKPVVSSAPVSVRYSMRASGGGQVFARCHTRRLLDKLSLGVEKPQSFAANYKFGPRHQVGAFQQLCALFLAGPIQTTPWTPSQGGGPWQLITASGCGARCADQTSRETA